MSRPDPRNAPAMSEPPARRGEQPAPPRLHASAQFRHGNEVLIEHGGETYRLRLTRQNRLILTK